MDENKNPLEEATVIYAGQVQKTDKNGIYSFRKVDVDSRHSFLTISKDGYFNGIRVFSTSKSGATISQRTVLLKKDFEYSFPSASGGKITTKDKVELNFPAASVVVEATGADYNGSVLAAVKYIDPTGDNLLFEMPGNLSAINNNQALQILTTYGMVNVELKSDKGEKLNIKQGKLVGMTIDVAAALTSKAPATIPLWHFDEGSGYWREDGSATLANGRYSGQVSHFSCWNYDSQNPSVHINGRVVDQNGNPVAGVHVWFRVAGDYSGGHGNTDDDGTFSGPVAKDELLEVSIFDYNGICSSVPIYVGQAGPFSADATIPDIVVNIPTVNQLDITGDFTDCNGNTVTDGYIKVYNGSYNLYYFPIENGQVNVTTSVCSGSGAYSLVAVDRAGLKETNPIPLTVPGSNNLGTVNICTVNADFLTIICSNIGVNTTITDSVGVYSRDGDGKFVNASNSSGFVVFFYNDGNQSDFNTGTFSINGGEFQVLDGSSQKRAYVVQQGSTIIITQAGAPGQKVIGTYTIYGQQSGTSVIETFTGSFQLTGY